MKTWRIYKHTLIIDCPSKGKSYIGQTFRTIEKRWNCGHGYSDNYLFSKAIKKYGKDAFSHEILVDNIQTQEEANDLERFYIAKFHTWIDDPECWGYNLTPGGEGGRDFKHTAEAKKKMSLAKLGRHHTAEYNANLSKITGGHEIICIETSKIYYSAGDAYRQTKIRHILEVCHHHREIAGGYHWAFVTDKDWISKFEQFQNQEKHITKFAKRRIRCIETGEEFESVAAAKRKYNITIIRINTTRTSAGYHWEYID